MLKFAFEGTDHFYSHAIRIADNDSVILSLLKGITSYIPTRYVTNKECNTYQYIDLTPSASDWDPYKYTFVN